jgi:GNAT superfamily N-acetyltransferase
VTAGPIETRPLAAADARTCDDIVGSLPYFFGDPDGIDLCRRAVREEEGLVALIDGDIRGFLTFRPHFAESVEITWMAVYARHRRRGIGRALIERLVAERADAGDRMLFRADARPLRPRGRIRHVRRHSPLLSSPRVRAAQGVRAP